MELRKLATALLIATPLACSVASAQVNYKGRPAAQPAEIYVGLIVKYKEGSSAKLTALSSRGLQVAQAKTGLRFASVREGGGVGAVTYRFGAPTSPADARAAALKLSQDPSVEWAVPDALMRLQNVAPTDPGFGGQWSLATPASAKGGANLPAAWTVTKGSNAVVVAVLDSGIRPGHPDLAGRLLPGYDFSSSDFAVVLGVPPNWFAVDGDGWDADPTDPGDYIDSALLAQVPPSAVTLLDLSVSPSTWHGTHVAGTIGAASNNGIGVTGVDWSARILPVRVAARGGRTPTSNVINGLLWAVGLPVQGAPANPSPARVLNLSLGGPGPCDAAYQDAINQVRAVGAIVVAATGNAAGEVGSPGNCAGVIAVTAHAIDGDNADYANVGPQTSISAPGGGCGFTSSGVTCFGSPNEVLSTMNAGTTVATAESYGYKHGTSMATPHVSGVIALMLALQPKLTAEEVKSVLQSSSRPHPPGTFCTSTLGLGMCGAGLLDAERALAYVSAQGPTANATRAGGTGPVRPGASFTLSGTYTTVGGRAVGASGAMWRQTSGPSVGLAGYFGQSVTVTAPPTGGTLGFEFSVTDSSGYSAVATTSVIVNAPPVLPTSLPAGSNVATIGVPASGRVTATDAEGDAITYALASGPGGMTIDASTGQWNFTPVTPGTVPFTVTVADAYGKGTDVTYLLAVNAPPSQGGGSGGGSSAVAPSGGGGGSLDLATLAGLLSILAASAVRRHSFKQ
jgi:serine protease